MNMLLRFLCLFICFVLHGELKVAIFTGKVQGLPPWDPDSVKRGITGSEEAVIYMSQKLAALGCKVTVFADAPEGSSYSVPGANPRFVGFDRYNEEKFDVGVCWRMPKTAAFFRQFAKKVYLWPHDLCAEQYTQVEILGFNEVLWLSRSQREQWLSINPEFVGFQKIFGNGINPEQFDEVAERKNPYSCIYASSYTRGLHVLLDIWPIVKRQFPRATLDVYYGWQKWGLLSLQEESKMKAQIRSMAFLGVREHGLVGHEELNRAYGTASFWTYPCTALVAETFCISALRAQFAGAVPVVIKGSALEETVRFGYFCRETEEYLATLLDAMSHAGEISLDMRRSQREFILQEYTWERMAAKWKALFDSGINQ
jgi:glycosyltransferase involved in cell wall biosynthesis